MRARLAVWVVALLWATTGVAAAQGYDVVSIHLSKSSDGNGMIDNSHGKLTVTNVPLKALIEEAYDLRSFQVVGTSDWMETMRFDIKAKTDADHSPFAALDKSTVTMALRQEYGRVSRLQLQMLLADRFHLKIHAIEKTAPAFDLIVDKGGLKAKLAEKEVGNGRWGAGKLEMQGVSITSFTRALAEAAGLERIVFDKTGLSGYYDFSLKWTPDQDNSAESDLPSLGDAMREQLGLQLKPVKEMVSFVVVDGADKPSGN